AFDDQHQEILFPVENTQLRSGDLVLIRSGERVPSDCLILWGEVSVDESIITGESLPVDKKAKDALIGGSILISGSAKAQVSAATADSVLAGIVRMVQQAQGEKPPIQQLADRISAVFVPLVLGIAILTFFGNYILGQSFAPSLMRSIAVLVIACPCAMGLATPAAIAVGLGRAARQGILFRNARHLESFKNIRQVVFDKTGTLTTGEFTIRQWKMESPALTEATFQHIVCSLEKYSNHPIAKSILREWQPALRQAGPGRNVRLPDLRWKKVEEVKGLGMRGETKTGDIYWAGSYKVAAALTTDNTHSVYIVHNDRLLGWIDTGDAIRPEAVTVIKWLHAQGIRTVLLSGDRLDACRRLAASVGIQEVLAEQTPEQKLSAIARLDANLPTAMVGDGINDAPALARATIGISMSDASQLAMQTADVVLVNHGLRHLPAALQLGRQTFVTIRQNLFWAFFYNVFAIPVAALGWLTPAVAALAMGFSDVVLAFNSLRLYVKKL
ncbi:MAG TPA: heavy metal translocating P-type ATPase, partial [Puia sp.]|nr:heavy metal translocating P-type ATPase [Puia sp.]